MNEFADEIGLGVFVLGVSEQLKNMFNIPSHSMPLVATIVGVVGSLAYTVSQGKVEPLELIVSAAKGLVVGITTTGTYAYVDKKTS